MNTYYIQHFLLTFHSLVTILYHINDIGLKEQKSDKNLDINSLKIVDEIKKIMIKYQK